MQKEFPGLICFGCMCHVYNLLFSDTCALPGIAPIFTDTNSIVKCFKRGQLAGQQLKSVQAGLGVKKDLEAVAATRFVSCFRSMRSVQHNQFALKAVVARQDFPTTKAARAASAVIK